MRRRDFVTKLLGIAVAPVSTTKPAPKAPLIRNGPAGTTGSWITIGRDYDTVTVPPNTTIRWGVPGRWLVKVVSDTVRIDAGTLGPDPAYGVEKRCDKWTGSGPAPDPNADTSSITPPPDASRVVGNFTGSNIG